MDILPLNFFACKMCGMWYESDRYYFIKMAYRVVVLAVITQLTLSLVAEIVMMKGTIDELTDVLFTCFTYTAFFFKILNFLFRRDEMYQLLDYFRFPYFKARSPDEECILKKHLDSANRALLMFMGLSLGSGSGFLIVPFANQGDDVVLPFKTYQPYNISNPVNYAVTYCLQAFALFFGIVLSVSMDLLVCGFIILATGQFELNSHRLKYETMSIKDCIRHHVLVQNVVAKIQYFFIPVIIPVFFFSLITFCTSIFRMSQKEVASFEFAQLVSYLFAMLYQVFLYCWYGNELELKQKDMPNEIYSTNWTDYSVEDRRAIWFIMVVSPCGSTINFHRQCSLTMENFLWIVKTSYASFNLLKTVSVND